MSTWPGIFAEADAEIAADKKKGPAEAATSPSRGSRQPLKGKPMNGKSNSTAAAAAPDFPIPYVMQYPVNDLLDALALLRVMDAVLDNGCQHGMSKQTVQEFIVPFSMVVERVKLVISFLNADDRPGTLDLYRRQPGL